MEAGDREGGRVWRQVRETGEGGRQGGWKPEGGRERVNIIITTKMPKFVDFLSTRPVRVAHIMRFMCVKAGR